MLYTFQTVNVEASTVAHIAGGSFIIFFASLFFFLKFFFSIPISLTQFPDGYILKASICYANALSESALCVAR